MTTIKLVLNTEIKASARAIGVAMFNGLLPQRLDITSRNFRTLLIDRINPTVYNHAKTEAVRLELTVDFGRSAGEPIGKKVELDEKIETKIHALLDKAEADAHVTAQNEDLVSRQAKADAEQVKIDAKAAKEKTRLALKATKDNEAADAKKLKAKERTDAKALKAKEKADTKELKDKQSADAKLAAKKVAKDQPEMKWQLVNKETNAVVEYAPDRKVAMELKKAHKDSANLVAKKIPTVA